MVTALCAQALRPHDQLTCTPKPWARGHGPALHTHDAHLYSPAGQARGYVPACPDGAPRLPACR
eukprot:6344700-Prymnesium_polylepis.2